MSTKITRVRENFINYQFFCFRSTNLILIEKTSKEKLSVTKQSGIWMGEKIEKIREKLKKWEKNGKNAMGS